MNGRMIVTKRILKEVYKPRNPRAHKYDFGSLLVIGGNKKYSGSPGFNALAAIAMPAYRSGVDIVEIAAPQRAADIVASFSPDIIAYPLDGDYITIKHIKKILEMAKNKSAVVVGGGMGREKKTRSFLRQFIKKISLPCVIDADAVYAVRGMKLRDNIVVTPHAYEFYILIGKKVPPSVNERIKIVKNEAKKLNCVILLKGNCDIISDGTKVAINKTGNAYMTKGGTGDTLAGICGSLLAQGIPAFKVACAAAYINGKAGDIIARKKKQGLTASDLIDAIPEVFK